MTKADRCTEYGHVFDQGGCMCGASEPLDRGFDEHVKAWRRWKLARYVMWRSGS